MSQLLEQAIIDATALKEAAIKNAERIILEKHASELKNAINSILEQGDEENKLDTLTNAVDDGMPPTENPLASNIPMAATGGENACPCPEDDQEIEINFDQLTQQINNPVGNPTQPNNNELPGQMGELKPEEDPTMIQESANGVQVPAQLGPELHMYHMSMDDPVYKVGELAYSGKSVPTSLLEQAISNLQSQVGKLGDPKDHQELEGLINELQTLLTSNPSSNNTEEPTEEKPADEDMNNTNPIYENIGLTEEIVKNVLEQLEINMQPVPHGHAGRATTAERIDAGEITLASTQDTKVAEENKDLKKALEKLQESNSRLKKQFDNINLENNKLNEIALKVSRKLEELNLENAKLMYMNRALRNNSLNERQKETIVENISKVDSVNEAKLVFETLQKTVKSSEKPKLPETLTETLNKGNMLVIKPSKTESIQDPLKERMQKLAGINKRN